MIYVTGDTHGDFTRFSAHAFPEQNQMSKNDYAIICGDFGIWTHDETDEYWLDWLNDKSFTTLFVSGNHSNYDILKEYPIQKWNGGNVQKIRESVIHLMRGQIFSIDGHTFFTMGGASSHDIGDGILEPDDPDFSWKRKVLDKHHGAYRINHISWWKEELPSDTEYAEANSNLEKANWDIDFIITHCAPTHIADLLSGGHYLPDHLTDYLESLSKRCHFKHWYFGHFHDDRTLRKYYHLLYRKIIYIDSLSLNTIVKTD